MVQFFMESGCLGGGGGGGGGGTLFAVRACSSFWIAKLSESLASRIV